MQEAPVAAQQQQGVVGVRQQPILLVCHRYHLQSTIEALFELGDPKAVWEQDAVTVREFEWKTVERLCIVSGVNHIGDRTRINVLTRLGDFVGGKIVYVCQNSAKQNMITNSRVVFPATWDVCVTVDELEAALGEPLPEATKRELEQRHLPRPLPPIARAGPRRRRQQIEQAQLLMLYEDAANAPPPPQGRRVIRIQRRDQGPVEAFGQMIFGMLAQEQAQFNEATRLSLAAYEEQRQGGGGGGNIRAERRNARPWDEVFQDVVVVGDGETPEDDHVCCVCTENYATIKTMDVAGKCDHVVMCDNCARIIMDKDQKCPVCRAVPMTVRRDTRYLPQPNNKKSKNTQE